MDHGLESKDVRTRTGKQPKGRLALRASREGERIVLRVEDDGAGIDPAAMRRVSVKRGMPRRGGCRGAHDAAARDLIFISGFTSKDTASDLSGVEWGWTWSG